MGTTFFLNSFKNNNRKAGGLIRFQSEFELKQPHKLEKALHV